MFVFKSWKVTATNAIDKELAISNTRVEVVTRADILSRLTLTFVVWVTIHQIQIRTRANYHHQVQLILLVEHK
jgi:hypothetical protein